MRALHFTTLICSFLFTNSFAHFEPDFSEGAPTPIGGRANLFQLSEPAFQRSVLAGKIHALEYPVEVSALVMPYRPLERVIEGNPKDPIRTFLGNIFGAAIDIHSMSDLFARAGLNTYPSIHDEGVYFVPRPTQSLPQDRMGLTRMDRQGVLGFTISCAACHSSNLFGKRVLGMTNRFPKSNDFFHYGAIAAETVSPTLFALILGANRAEKQVYTQARKAIRRTETLRPLTDGLDTSLAQVSLSLSRRSPDEYATPNPIFEKNPREEKLRTLRADSKPAVWWNVKFKNRWLSDGSVVSGNPIFTNLLWNEIGRGTDLRILEDWLKHNTDKVNELASAVFASEAPRWTDFFDPDSLSLDSAKRGQTIFQNRCTKCHGTYLKKWDLADASKLSTLEKLQTSEVRYPEQTRVMDVQTDPLRHQGMSSLAVNLNPLAISKNFGTVIKPQKGYVPPPLVGIWARWPYFHNNSIPSLCALLTKSSERPKTWYMGEANNRDTDYNQRCGGYPLGNQTPIKWKADASKKFDTSMPGLSNTGHDEKIFLDQGRELLSISDKWDLIEFLKTL